MISSIFIFLIVLSLLVLVHEFGHFYVAKRSGIWVEEFGFGIPPRIAGIKVGETLYSINLLPFGGFVRLHGEQTEEGVTKPKRAFINKPTRVKIPVIIAGVIMNFLLAVVAFSIVYSASGVPRNTENVRIVAINEGSPADMSGLEDGDIVRKVDGQNITTVGQFVDYVDESGGEEVNLLVERETGKLSISVVPRENPPEDEGAIGVAITTTEIYFPPLWQRPFLGVYYGFREAIFWGTAVIAGLYQLIVNLFKGVVPQDITGPVGIFAITNEAAKVGTIAVINFIGVFSVNLAILNIFPFPALDGGRLLFLGIESIYGKRVIPKVEATIHAVGMAILILILIAVTYHDIKRLVEAGSISGFLDSVSGQ